MTIRPKTPHEVSLMQDGGKILNHVLQDAYAFITAGQSLMAIDAYIYKQILTHHAKPSFLGFKNYPASACLSVNEAVVHGIPNDYILVEGDIIGVDVGIFWEGYHTDAAFTKGIGSLTKDKAALIAVTQASLREGIDAALAGNTVGDIGTSIETYVKSQGKYGIIRDLSGHGVGASLQEAPEVVNYATKDKTPLINNMTLALEPMISLGDWHVTLASDEWTVLTQDKSPAAHFETTIVISDNDPLILIPFPLTC
jgi:methionyl aminopeptidase